MEKNKEAVVERALRATWASGYGGAYKGRW